MTRHESIKNVPCYNKSARIIALLTLVCFLWAQAAWAVPEGNLRQLRGPENGVVQKEAAGATGSSPAGAVKVAEVKREMGRFLYVILPNGETAKGATVGGFSKSFNEKARGSGLVAQGRPDNRTVCFYVAENIEDVREGQDPIAEFAFFDADTETVEKSINAALEAAAQAWADAGGVSRRPGQRWPAHTRRPAQRHRDRSEVPHTARSGHAAGSGAAKMARADGGKARRVTAGDLRAFFWGLSKDAVHGRSVEFNDGVLQTRLNITLPDYNITPAQIRWLMGVSPRQTILTKQQADLLREDKALIIISCIMTAQGKFSDVSFNDVVESARSEYDKFVKHIDFSRPEIRGFINRTLYFIGASASATGDTTSAQADIGGAEMQAAGDGAPRRPGPAPAHIRQAWRHRDRSKIPDTARSGHAPGGGAAGSFQGGSMTAEQQKELSAIEERVRANAYGDTDIAQRVTQATQRAKTVQSPEMLESLRAVLQRAQKSFVDEHKITNLSIAIEMAGRRLEGADSLQEQVKQATAGASAARTVEELQSPKNILAEAESEEMTGLLPQADIIALRTNIEMRKAFFAAMDTYEKMTVYAGIEQRMRQAIRAAEVARLPIELDQPRRVLQDALRAEKEGLVTQYERATLEMAIRSAEAVIQATWLARAVAASP